MIDTWPLVYAVFSENDKAKYRKTGELIAVTENSDNFLQELKDYLQRDDVLEQLGENGATALATVVAGIYASEKTEQRFLEFLARFPNPPIAPYDFVAGPAEPQTSPDVAVPSSDGPTKKWKVVYTPSKKYTLRSASEIPSPVKSPQGCSSGSGKGKNKVKEEVKARAQPSRTRNARPNVQEAGVVGDGGERST